METKLFQKVLMRILFHKCINNSLFYLFILIIHTTTICTVCTNYSCYCINTQSINTGRELNGGLWNLKLPGKEPGGCPLTFASRPQPPDVPLFVNKPFNERLDQFICHQHNSGYNLNNLTSGIM